MLTETELGMQAVDEIHPLVPNDLRDNGGARDRKRPRISIHHRRGGNRTGFGHVKPIDKNQVRDQRKFSQRPDHGQVGRSMDSNPVDLLGSRGAHADGRRAQNRAIGRFTSPWGQTLRIVEEQRGRNFKEDDSGSDNRTGERAAAGFIDTG